MKEVTFKAQTFNCRHGGPFDRGAADSWYSRPYRPHYFIGGSYDSEEVLEKDMTEEEIQQYYAGYDYNEQYGGKKDYQ